MRTKFFALDFDRTLGATSTIASKFTSFIGRENEELGAIISSKQHKIESSGGSFDIVDALRHHIGTKALQAYMDTFIELQQDMSFLNEGAASLIDAIQESNHHLGILTFGGKQWQEMKLRAATLERYDRMIVAEKGKKALLIASWYDKDQEKYQLPDEFGGGLVDEVVLVDDKAIEFSGLPENGSARGYLFRDMSIPILPSQQAVSEGDIPTTVTVVASLSEVVEKEDLYT